MTSEQDWYAQTWAGQRDVLLRKAEEMMDMLSPVAGDPEFAEELELLQDVIYRLRNVSANPSFADQEQVADALLRDLGLDAGTETAE